jgi:hypothetical protein
VRKQQKDPDNTVNPVTTINGHYPKILLYVLIHGNYSGSKFQGSKLESDEEYYSGSKFNGWLG